MAKTLLQMTQDILSSMDGDEISTITETVESQQIVDIIRTNYEHIAAQFDLPEHKDFFQLTSPADVNKPTKFTLPTGVIETSWVKYDKQVTGDSFANFQMIDFVPIEDFLYRVHMRTGTGVESYTDGDLTLLVYNDRFPSMYTTAGDDTFYFDAYYSTEESYLHAARTLCYGLKEQTFTESDSFEFPLDYRQVNLLFNEAKSQAFVELKQVGNPNSDRKSRRGWIEVQRTKRATPDVTEFDKLPYYGRK